MGLSLPVNWQSKNISRNAQPVQLKYQNEPCRKMWPAYAKSLCKYLRLYLNDAFQDSAEVLAFTFHLFIDSFIYFFKPVNFEAPDR